MLIDECDSSIGEEYAIPGTSAFTASSSSRVM